MNFRTEVHFIGESELCPTDEGDLVDQLKEDFANYGKEMADVRKHLEHWDEFINPYQRICASIDVLRRDLESLDLKPQDDAVPDLNHDTDMAEYQRQWTQVSERYSRGIGICFGIRAMLPVRAESFINMLLFILMRSDVRRDQRLFDSVFRQQIDVRVKSLHLHCNGFRSPVEYSELTEFHSLMMNRNDLLHGNVSLDKLQYGDVRFLGRVPIFTRYLSFWVRAHGVMLKNVGFEEWEDELGVVESTEDYLLTLVDDEHRPFVEAALRARVLGTERSDNRLGVLFSEVLVDHKMGGTQEQPV